MARIHLELEISEFNGWLHESVKALLILLGLFVAGVCLFAYDGVLDYGSPVEARLKLTLIFLYSALYFIAVNVYPKITFGMEPPRRTENSDIWAMMAIGGIFHYFILWVYFNEVHTHHLIGSLFVMCFVVHLIGLVAAPRYFVVPGLFIVMIMVGGLLRLYWGGFRLLDIPELSGLLLHLFPSL